MSGSAFAGFGLDGKVALVTGGSRGLGLAMCHAFAEHGATVVVSSRKEARCREVAEALTAATGRPSMGVGCHVGRWADCDELVTAVYDAYGRIDILVNNAGMSPLYPSLDEVSEDLFDKVIAVNLKGAFRLSATIGARMAHDNGGAIINISSIAAVQPSGEELPYALAKAGLNALTVGMARALGAKVRVNAIMAGPFMTDVALAWDLEQFRELAEQAIPLRRGGEPVEIVGAALYLASDASSFTTGAIIKIDGGYAHAPA